jgi:hypothetical protein
MYLRKVNLTEKQKEHLFLLQSFNLRDVIFLQRTVASRGRARGAFFIINSCGQVIDITWSMAVLFDVAMIYDGDKRMIEVDNVETMMRDVSELVYKDWSRIRVFTLV